MFVLAIVLSLSSAAPTSAFDRLSNTTTWVAANKGLKLLIPVGSEMHITTQGQDKRVVDDVDVRFWATLAGTSTPDLGILGGAYGNNVGALLIDGVRIDAVSCAMPPVPTRTGRFTTWHRDISLTAKGLRAVAAARTKIEIACGKRVEEITGNELTNFASMAKLFASSSFPSDGEERRQRQDEFDKKEAQAERADRVATSKAAAVGGEMALVQAKKMMKVASCIASEFEEDDEADVAAVTQKCKGFIDANGNLIGAR